MAQDEVPDETSVADAFLSGGSEIEISTPDLEPPPDQKPRRGRKAKQPTPDIAAEESPLPEPAEIPDEMADPIDVAEPAEAVEPAAKPAPKSASPRKTGRNREPEASAPPPLDVIEEQPSPVEPNAAAAQWHAESGTVTFDWPSIEQVAAVEGPNQPMAKLLLAARAEGANSRWPF